LSDLIAPNGGVSTNFGGKTQTTMNQVSTKPFATDGPVANAVVIKQHDERLQLSIEIDKQELNMYLQVLSDLLRRRKRKLPQPFESKILTKREREIAGMLLDGKTNRSIAERLFISLETVKTHRRNLFRKLECKKITELMTKFS